MLLLLRGVLTFKEGNKKETQGYGCEILPDWADGAILLAPVTEQQALESGLALPSALDLRETFPPCDIVFNLFWLVFDVYLDLSLWPWISANKWWTNVVDRSVVTGNNGLRVHMTMKFGDGVLSSALHPWAAPPKKEDAENP